VNIFYLVISDGQNSLPENSFFFKIENTVLFFIFKILLKTILPITACDG